MKKRIVLLTPLLFAASCARFPGTDSAASRFPRVSFTVRMQGPINDAGDDTPTTSYVYIVAIRAIKTEDVPNVGAPSPITGDGTQDVGNGFVAGSPTHFILYDGQRPTQPYPYRLYRFDPSTTPDNPAQAVDLTRYVDIFSFRGPIVNFVRPSDSSNRSELNFDVFLNQLANSDEEASQIKKLQINILTMNVPATESIANRAWDAIGNSRNASEINSFITVDLRTNQQFISTEDVEPTGDVVNFNDPSLDIQSFTVRVTQP